MKQILVLTLSFLGFVGLNAQSNYEEVYSIFQTNCATAYCHASGSNSGNLDLEGTGATLADKQAAVYNSIYKATPDNAVAANKDNYIIYPGDPYRSFLFRKISSGFSDDNPLETGEGDHMPDGGTMSDYEKEVIRQWIIYGAKETGNEADLTQAEEYYTNGGIESVAAAPAPPNPSEGFQIHLGPFFIPPGAEVEYLSKYETLLDETLEITKFQTEMGDFSHHFIVYNFSDDFGAFDPNTIPYGLRQDIDFDGKSFVLTEQYSNTLETPEGSAFKWEPATVLDLNSHYINYSSTEVLKCDVYLNVYTQDEGVANQEMFSQLIPNTNINIPNNGQEITFTSPFSIPSNLNVYIWGAVAHTHQYGTDFNIYRRNSDGSQGEQVYDAGCANGIPGCAVEDYDYKHLPFRFWEPFMPVNLQEGVIAEASYLNDGPNSVQWGLTSDDEMMIFVIFYTLDTTGVNFENDTSTVGIRPDLSNKGRVDFYPNPANNLANISISDIPKEASSLKIFDVNGRVCQEEKFIQEDQTLLNIDLQKFVDGMYFFQIFQNTGSVANGKFVVRKDK